MVCAHLPITEETCSLTDRWLLTVTPSILMEETRWMLSNGFGNCTWRRRVLSTNTISTDFLRLSFRLLVLAQVWIMSNSSVRESMLLAGITRQVSSAYLQNLLPEVKGIRSPALTTYETGPIAEPWIMLADIFSKGEIWPWKAVQWEWPENNLPASYTHSLEYRDLPVSEEEKSGGPYQTLYWNQVQWRAVISAFKLSVQIVCMRASAPENRSRFRNDRIALSINSCVKSFHIDSKAFSVRQCCLFLAYIVSIAPTHDNPVDLNISEVILKSELKFNYLFIYKKYI